MIWGDIFWFSLRWLHFLAAASWIGSALFFITVVEPSFKIGILGNGQSERISWTEKLKGVVVGEWREFLEITAFVLVISGALLAFNRLSQPNISSTYAIVLGVKVALTIVMAFIALRKIGPLKKSKGMINQLFSASRFMVGLGAVVILLAIILRAIYDKSIAP